MKTLATLTLAALTLLSLNGASFAGKIHSLNDIHDAEQNARKVSTPESVFTGRGHKVGGDKYVNRLLGINHKEGKRLAKLTKKSPQILRHKFFLAKDDHTEILLAPLALAFNLSAR